MNNAADQPTDLEAALLDSVRLFESLDIQYALVGGLAAMVYGKSRFTEDVDFVAIEGHMQTLAENAQAMKQHGFDPTCTWKLYHQSGIAIDLWKDEFANAIVSRSRAVDLSNTAVKVACAEDLIAMKLRADRPQDEYDISEILKSYPLNEELLDRLMTEPQAKRLDEIRRRIGHDKDRS